MNQLPRLVADIGGTNARFALVTDTGALNHQRTMATRDYETLTKALAEYLNGAPVRPRAACLAIACPISGDAVQMTNHHWRFSQAELQGDFGWEALAVINDFQAVALAVPHLSARQYIAIGGGTLTSKQPQCVLGPGTGLGVALLIPQDDTWLPISTEGGHAGLAPGNERELAVFDFCLKQGEVLSREHFLSGPGIVRLYKALCALNDAPVWAEQAIEVSLLASEHDDAIANDALEMFFALLGSACGDQALASGARGGVFLAGGILPRLQDRLLLSAFRERFEAKDPMRDYVSGIGTVLITEPCTGLLGAAHYPLATDEQAVPDNPTDKTG